MRIPELGQALRTARLKRGLTRAELAVAAGLARNTLNRIENGLFPDLGIRKASTLLQKLGLDLTVKPIESKPMKPDFVEMASASVGVSFKDQLAPDELVQ